MSKKSIAFILASSAVVAIVYIFFNIPKSVQTPIKNKQSAALEISFDSLVWHDEFNGQGTIDTTKWFHQTQIPKHGEWWGGIIQHYTDRVENSYLNDGNLFLVAKKEPYTAQGWSKEYTAARLNSKFAFTYGRVEIRAKLPKGFGTWPAIWMLNKNINEKGAYWEKLGYGKVNWPLCGEIDILEHWGARQNYVSSALHNGASYGDYVTNIGGQNINDVSDSFHIYTLEWTKDKMIFAVDQKTHYVYKPTVKNDLNWPYDTDYYLILNIAIKPDISPDFIQSPMVVDYIRIYQ